MEHHVSSAIRGHHVSKSFRTPAIDEIVTAITEDSNTHDHFAVRAVDRSRYQKCMRLTSSTKDRKGCAYDRGALNKQGALQN